MKPPLATIILLIGWQLTSACCQQFENKTARQSCIAQIKERYDCTTTCSNIYSLSDATFSCKDYHYTYLNITESNVTVLHSGDFSEFEQSLNLYLIGINIEEIQPGTFNGLSKPIGLYLQNNHLTRLSNGAFDGLPGLSYLDLSNNRLSHIEAKVFSKLFNLKEVKLQQNRLTVIEHNLFNELHELRYINLSENAIHLGKLHLGRTARLKTLDISNISLTDADLQSDLFVPLKSRIIVIHTIKLSSNSLTNPDCALLPNAGNLNLSNNKLVNLQNISKLKTKNIILDNNHLKSIEGFDGEVLHLSNNEIETVSKNLAGQKLVTLTLSFNNIAVINDDTFGNLTSLRNLDLQHNKISKIPPNLFLNTTRLEKLDLSFNLIEDIQNGTFNSFLWLNELNIAHNRFTILPHLSFLSHLETLRFDFNNISTLNTKDLTILPSLRNVYLNGNNWECKQLVQMYKQLKLSNIEVFLKG